MGIRSELVETIKQFIDMNEGREPIAIHLTQEDERRLMLMPRDEAGGSINGPVRKRFERFGGAQIVWDAEWRHCE
jgi:hypothetical protein